MHMCVFIHIFFFWTTFWETFAIKARSFGITIRGEMASKHNLIQLDMNDRQADAYANKQFASPSST